MPETGSELAPLSTRADAELRLPAEGAYVSVLRTATAGLAARLDFTLDDIEDLRMAVGEAAAMALEHAAEGTDLSIRFWLSERAMTVAVAVTTAGTATIDRDSFAWQVLTTLAADASARAEEGHLELSLAIEATPLGDAF